MQSNENLLVKNKIVYKEKIKNKLKVTSDLLLLTYQKPNNKFFYLLPIKLSIYNMANNNARETKFKWWLKNKLGEPPVVFQEPLILGASSSMKNYMFNLGFLHNNVTATVKIKNKKAIVTYTVIPSERYKINKIILPKPTDDITKIISENQKESFISKKDYLNINTIDDERQRLTNVLRNNGYYLFNKEYFNYDIDSLGKKNALDLILNIKPPTIENGHNKFYIGEVTIYTDYAIEKRNDSLALDSFDYEGYHFVTEKNSFKPKPILLGVFLKKNDVYSLENHNRTIQKIVSFGSFKFVNIEYKLNKNNQLDAFIFLTPSKRQELQGDIELSHSFAGLSGASVSLMYKNKNLTKKSDLLQFKVSSGIELNLFNSNINNSTSLFNNAEVSTELSYFVNRFIVPFPLKKVSKNSNVKTKFSLKYSYENRIQRFTKHSASFSAGYEWNETQRSKLFYNPFYVSLFLIPTKHEDFVAQLEKFPSLANSFEENVVLGSNYTFLTTNKKGEDDRSYFKFQGNVDLAGNFIHMLMLAAKSNSSDTIPYQILGKAYAQYARFEANIVQNNKISPTSELVTHFNAGIIIPYGNSKTAPYFQQFFAGGPNSVRAFRLRALGPGSYVGDNAFQTDGFNFDQTGDIKIEANIEYRFDLWKWFRWAFFVDAGNVWLLNPDVDRQNGHFTETFYKDIAVGFGTGLRMDFTYFVIRTDLAMPIVDPRFKDTWRLNKIDFTSQSWRENNLIFSLAIGYPF